MPIRIRQATIDDLATIFHLGEDLFTSEEFPNLYRTWDEFEVIGYFLTSSDNCFVAEDEDRERVVGFALGTTIEKKSTAWDYGHLVWLGVHEKYQKRGVASMLVKAFRERMREEGIRMLLVDTQVDNVRAVRFFEKMGFGNPVEHVYMTHNLSRDED